VSFNVFDVSNNCTAGVASRPNVPVSNGGVAATTLTLPAGDYQVTADYSGDDNNNGVQVPCAQAKRVTVAASPNPPTPAPPVAEAPPTMRLALQAFWGKNQPLLALPRTGTFKVRVTATNLGATRIEKGSVKIVLSGVKRSGKLPAGLTEVDGGKALLWAGGVDAQKPAPIPVITLKRTAKEAQVRIERADGGPSEDGGQTKALDLESGRIRLQPAVPRVLRRSSPRIRLTATVDVARCAGRYKVRYAVGGLASTVDDTPALLKRIGERCRATWSAEFKTAIFRYSRVRFWIQSPTGGRASNKVAVKINR
jgi:hypothetical protein